MLARSLLEYSPDGVTRLFWYKMQFLGYGCVPIGFLCLALRYSGYGHRLTYRTQFLLSVFPALSVGLIFTNEMHGLVWNLTSTSIIASSDGSLPVSAWGIWNWLFVGYTYSTLGLGVFFLTRTLARSRHIYGWQASGIVLAAIVAWLSSALDTFQVSPFPPFVATALGFIVGIITATLALSRLHRRDLLSVTRATMLNSISDCIVVVDGADRVVDINPAAEKLVVTPAAQVIGKPFDQFLPDLKFNENSIDGGTHEVVLCRENRSLTFDLRISPIRDLQGCVVSRVIALRDITERKQAEVALRASEAQLQYIIAGAQAWLVNVDTRGRFTYVNSALAKAMGCTVEEMLGRLYLRFVHPEDRYSVGTFYRDQIKSGEKSNMLEFRLVTTQGQIRWVRFVSSLNIENGQVVGQTGIAMDITDRKRAEESQQASHDRLLIILDSIDADIYVADLKTHEILFMNRHMRESFGDHLVGQICWQVFRVGSLPCADCSNPKLVDANGNPTGLYVWEGQNSITQRWYTNYDRAIQWIDGRLVRLEISTDITDRKRVEEETALKNKHLTTLNELGHSLNKLATPNEIVERIDEMIGKVFNNRNFYVALYDEARNALSFPIYRIEAEGRDLRNVTRPFGNGITEFVIRTKAPLLIPDRMQEALAERGVSLIGQLSQCYLAAPMLINDKVLGVLAVQDYERAHVYDTSHVELLSTVASQAAIALENARLYATVQQELNERKRAEEQLTHNAFHDALTGLPNRALFMDRLGHALERAKRHPESFFAVLFLDLDRFKVVNDSLGHAIGDQLLIESARRLTQCVRIEDTVARLGGDEFVILLDGIHDNVDAMLIADRIQQALASSFEFDPHHIFISVSIGIVQSATGYECAEDVLRDADVAMYRAKTLGRGRYEVFDTEMHDRAMTRLELESDLRRAVEQSEFTIYYQPIISFATNRIAGFEALVRWRHPIRGLVAPAEFIPMAEETGLIIPIGQWVLQEACRQMREWQTQFAQESPLTISVNFSTKQFTQTNLVEKIATTLHETGLSAQSLKLELTESLIVEDMQAVAIMLDQLRALGVQVQIDDFGTGYSSLGYLHRLPIDTLKIDRTFINRMGVNGNGPEIVRTILALAHDMGMKVIAEGVETMEQVSKLKNMECEYGQGYYFTQPLDSLTASEWIAKSFHER